MSSIDVVDLFDGVSGSLDEEQLQTLFASANVKIERIVSTGHITPPGEWYDQDQDEWVLVLAGSARLTFENDDETVALTPGQAILIPAHRRHRVSWTDKKQPTVWLAVHVWPSKTPEIYKNP